jgi:hypothetical protein
MSVVEVVIGEGADPFRVVLSSRYTYGAVGALAREQGRLAKVIRRVRVSGSARGDELDAATVRLQEEVSRILSAQLAAHVLGFRGDAEAYQPFMRLDWPSLDEHNALDRRIRTLGQLFSDDVSKVYARFKELTGVTDEEEATLRK